MEVLKGYGVGRNLRRIIGRIWQGDTMVPRQGGYYGRPLRARRGVRQGDIVSPLIFNIMADAVVRHWRHVHLLQDITEMSVFYADDGLLTGSKPDRVQDSIDVITKVFVSVRLKMNAQKTEYLVMTRGRQKVCLTSMEFNGKFTDGLSYKDQQKQNVVCVKCGAEVQRASLKGHQLSLKCQKASETYRPPTPVRKRHACEQARAPVEDTKTDRISILVGCNAEVHCLVDGCDWKTGATNKKKRFSTCLHFRQ